MYCKGGHVTPDLSFDIKKKWSTSSLIETPKTVISNPFLSSMKSKLIFKYYVKWINKINHRWRQEISAGHVYSLKGTVEDKKLTFSRPRTVIYSECGVPTCQNKVKIILRVFIAWDCLLATWITHFVNYSTSKSSMFEEASPIKRNQHERLSY